MLLRNATIVLIAAILSVLCYQKMQWSRHAATVSEALELIKRNYVEPVEERELFEAAMNGMASKLDPYSSYIPPRELTELQADLDQEFGGIGVMVEVNPQTKRPTIISPIFDTPAYRAGIRAGDVILKVDGIGTEEIRLRDAIDRIHGKVGEAVTLTILHAGEKEPVELKIVRAVIRTDSVLGDTRNANGSWNFFLEEDPRILYLRVVNFGERTGDELRTALQSRNAEGKPAAAAIIDLRDNAGGLLTAAVDAADLLLDDGEIVSTKTRGGVDGRHYHATKGQAFDAQAPIVVLINRFSASASEILAACLQDHQRAVVIGQRSWGKGTVQNVLYLEGGQSALKLTTASYWRPSNRNIHRMRNAKDDDEWGVRPNPGFEVILDEATTTKVARWRRYRDQYHAEKWGVLLSGSAGDSSKPSEKPVAKPSDTPIPKPADKPDENSGTKPDDKPADKADEKPSATSGETSLLEVPEKVDDAQLRKAIDYLHGKIDSKASSP